MFLKLKRNLFSDGLVLGLMELVKALLSRIACFSWINKTSWPLFSLLQGFLLPTLLVYLCR
jgi:4-hydroxybenzoate polyprenyltransferase